ncbi:MAG: hypothetical protein KH031_24030 [Clostridiales bacterium]|nr:hypothetical protein [Clostridiales bacterium]
MGKITEKSTKKEIMEAYQDALAKLNLRDSMKDDPVREAAKEREAIVMTDAANIVNAGILNDDYLDKYNKLMEALSLLDKRIKERYEIEAELNSLTALINSHKDLEVAKEEEYKILKEKLANEMSEKKAELQAEISDLEQQKKDKIMEIKTESDAMTAKIIKDRQRAEEEYSYNLRRQRKLENDTWEDEKAAREKELAINEKIVAEKEAMLDEELEKIETLKGQVSHIPVMLEEAKEEGVKKGKADADKSHVFEVRSLKQQYEYEQKLATDKIQRLEAAAEEAKNKIAELQNKLDNAYIKMNELATNTVQANGGVRILTSDNDKK